MRVGVCLSGCGVYDGSEIHEAVLTLLALDQAGAKIICLAPAIAQAEVVDHRTGTPIPGHEHQVLNESARIARGEIRNLAEVTARDLDALIFPGGFGAVKNLCTYAHDGVNCAVSPEVERIINEMVALRRPIGALCIAPVLLARVLGPRMTPRLTIGNDPATAAALAAMGAVHEDCPVGAIVIDEALRLVSTPAYMLGHGPAEIFEGIRRLVDAVLSLAVVPAGEQAR